MEHEEAEQIDALYERVQAGVRDLPPAKLTQLSKLFTQSGMQNEAEATSRLFSVLTASGSGSGSRRRSTPGVTAVASSKLSSYLLSHGDRAPPGSVISYVEACNCVSTSLTAPALLQAVLDHRTPVQVAALNDPNFAKPEAFPLLCLFLSISGVWACNLGEIAFSAAQCEQLGRALAAGGVGFLFVDEVHVGKEEKRKLKAVIKLNRERRLRDGTEPWLLSENEAQNAVIRSLPCQKMWFGPLQLARNKRFEEARKEAARAQPVVPGVAMPLAMPNPQVPAALADASQAAVAHSSSLEPPALSQQPSYHPYGRAAGWGPDASDDSEDDVPLSELALPAAPTPLTLPATQPPLLKRDLSATSKKNGQPDAVRRQTWAEGAAAGGEEEDLAPRPSAAAGGEGIVGLVKQLSIQ